MLNANISNTFVKSMNLLKEFDYQDIKFHSCQFLLLGNTSHSFKYKTIKRPFTS